MESNESEFINAVYKRELEAIDRLVDTVYINCVDEFGNTALHYAAGNGDYELTAFLLQRGACVSIHNSDNLTPLSYAIQYMIGEGFLFNEDFEIVFSLLVSHGASTNEIESLENELTSEYQLETLSVITNFVNDVTFTSEEALNYAMEYINPEEDNSFIDTEQSNNNFNLPIIAETTLTNHTNIPTTQNIEQEINLYDHMHLSILGSTSFVEGKALTI
jgi:hypothetical protein